MVPLSLPLGHSAVNNFSWPFLPLLRGSYSVIFIRWIKTSLLNFSNPLALALLGSHIFIEVECFDKFLVFWHLNSSSMVVDIMYFVASFSYEPFSV